MKKIMIQHLLLMAALVLPAAGQSYSRAYEAPFISDPILVDGRLTESVWASVPQTDSYILYGSLDTPTSTTTHARIAWDAQFLYVGVEAVDEDIWSTHTAHDSNLWEQDVLEVFIDPEGDAEGYLEFEVSPRNVVLDLWVEKPLFSQGGPSHFEWNAAGLQTAVHIEGSLGGASLTSPERQDTDTGWSMELALPWSDVAIVSGMMALPPKPGDVWRMNVTRYDYRRGSEELSQWSPSDVRGAWHEPGQYGYVTFSGPVSSSVDPATWGQLKVQQGE